MAERVVLARRLSWCACGVLLAQQAVDAALLQMPWILWVGKLLPLLLFLPGMLRERVRSYIWLCFVSLLYFIALVERLFAQPDSLLALIGLLAVILLFISAMMYARWRGRELRDALAQTGEPEHE